MLGILDHQDVKHVLLNVEKYVKDWFHYFRKDFIGNLNQGFWLLLCFLFCNYRHVYKFNTMGRVHNIEKRHTLSFHLLNLSLYFNMEPELYKTFFPFSMCLCCHQLILSTMAFIVIDVAILGCSFVTIIVVAIVVAFIVLFHCCPL